MSNARLQLDKMRIGEIGDVSVQTLKMDLKREGLSLEDIGSNETEIAGLIILMNKKFAIEYLDKLRKNELLSAHLWEPQSRLRESNLSPEDIGTTVDELNEFGKKVDGSTPTWE
jgi:hypothetical protein